jgi:RNA polymerase sigma-70 factor, ECF subfamily
MQTTIAMTLCLGFASLAAFVLGMLSRTAAAFNPHLAGAQLSASDGANESGPPGGGPGGRDVLLVYLLKHRTRKDVRAWLLRLMIPRQDVDDLTQEVLASALASAHTYRPDVARPERWLNKIAVHKAAHYLQRAQHRREEMTGDPPEAEHEGQSPEQVIEREETRLSVLEALSRLPPHQAAVIAAHDIEGIPMEAIARRSGVPVSTLYKWRSRGLDALAALLRPLRG